MTWLIDKAQLVHLVIPWEKVYFPEDTKMAKKQWKDSWEKFSFYLHRTDYKATQIAFSSRYLIKEKKNSTF